MQSDREWTNLRDHLSKEHNFSPFQTYLREIVYGGNDGIVTTFAVVAGFAGAAGDSQIGTLGAGAVLLFGFANLFADAASMGLGNFLSVRSDQDVYRKEEAKEREEIHNNPHIEELESVEILQSKGFTKEDANALTQIYKKNKQYWLEFMMKDELELQDPTTENPLYTALSTFIAFIIFGSIPLAPYVLFSNLENPFMLSVGFTFAALCALGILRWKVTQQPLVRSLAEVLLIGGTSASIAFFVGTLFKI